MVYHHTEGHNTIETEMSAMLSFFNQIQQILNVVYKTKVPRLYRVHFVPKGLAQ